jgi:TctA family transporter
MRLGFPLAPMLLGFVLGPMMEENLRRSMLMAGGDATVFFQPVAHPISLTFMIVTVLIMIVMLATAVRSRRGEITG